MKITRTFLITQDEFYDHLGCNLIELYHSITRINITAKDIKKGLTFSKNEDDPYTRIDLTLLAYKRGEIYKMSIVSMSYTVETTYVSKPTTDGLTITYIQTPSIQTHQNIFMRTFSEIIYLGKMSQTLYDIQKKIMCKRDGIPIQHSLIHSSSHNLLKKWLSK